MNRRVVTMALTETSYRQFKIKDGYKFDPHGRWAWLQKLAWKLLHKTHALANAYDERPVYKTVTLDGDRLLNDLLRVKAYAFDQWGRKPTQVLMGPKQMAELGQELPPNLRAPINFEGRMSYDGEVIGIPIRVIPHMEGVLVL